jgi:hypothetical protein
MKNTTKLYISTTLAMLLMIVGNAQASVAYNITGWDTSGAGGLDGGFPANWVGSAAPGYTGTLNAMWYADVGNGTTESVSSSDARSKGADPTFALAVGPRAWNDNTSGTQGQGHGSDFGLIHLNGLSDLTVTVSADTVLGSNLKPGFSLFSGWDTGTSSFRVGAYQNNANNPLGTTGLVFRNSASTTTPGGNTNFVFTNLAAGNYTLFVGGNFIGGTGAAGKYTVNLSASPVPVPAAAWMMVSGLMGLLAVNRKKVYR